MATRQGSKRPRKAKKPKLTELRSILNNVLTLVEREPHFMKKDSRGRLERGVSVSRDRREKERKNDEWPSSTEVRHCNCRALQCMSRVAV